MAGIAIPGSLGRDSDKICWPIERPAVGVFSLARRPALFFVSYFDNGIKDVTARQNSRDARAAGQIADCKIVTWLWGECYSRRVYSVVA